MFSRDQILFIILGGFFICNALIAEFIGVKIFSLEETLGLEPATIHLFGESYSFNLTVGVLLWPVVFVMTDVINEYYGMRGVRLLSYLTAGLITYAFVMFYFGIQMHPAEFWVERQLDNGETINMDTAFNTIFGQGLWIIIGSLCAFLVGQVTDAWIFKRIRRVTGESKVWLRATGSTLVSQFIDSFLVLFIAFYIGPPHFSFSTVIALGLVGYTYKFVVALLLTPVIYAAHWAIDQFLGEELATKMKHAATQ